MLSSESPCKRLTKKGSFKQMQESLLSVLMLYDLPAGDNSALADMLKKERGAMLFQVVIMLSR